MKNKLYLLFLFTGLITNSTFSQISIEAIQKDYDNLSYYKLIEELLPEVEKSKEPSKILLLADSYFFNGQMEEASKWYKELSTENLDKEILFRYIQSLKAIENYSLADKMMIKFIELNPNDSRSKLFKNNYLDLIGETSDDFKLNNLEINTPFSDFGVSDYDKSIIFASSRNQSNKKYNWNDQPFLDLFVYDTQGNIKEISGKVNTRHHESSTTFTKDGQTIYFTRNNSKKNNENIIGLKVYRAILKKGKWTNVESLPFNSDNYNVAHPALNVEETKLYFTSDMPGSIGGSDIFFVDINSDGSFGSPKNLGSKINTEGRENFPFVSDNGTLYFSSDSHIGLGGLDVFMIKDEKIINLGKPINSPRDDFGYIINENSLKGYVTSNRPGGVGDDDIYSFKRNPCKKDFTGNILDKSTLEIISDADLTIYNKDNNAIDKLKSDENGMFFYQLPCDDQDLRIVGEKDNFENDTLSFSVLSGIKNLELKLKPIPKTLFDKNDKNELKCAHYSIIAGSFTKKINAERKIESLKKEGYNASLAQINPNGFYRVAYERFKSKSKAIKFFYYLKYTQNKDVWFLVEQNTALCKSILYDFNSSKIRPEAEETLLKIIDYLNYYPEVKIILSSHTDSRGDEEYNKSLSIKRNNSATKFLVEKGGIERDRISVESFGETTLTNDCPSGVDCEEDLHQDNRRTEFIFIEQNK